MRHVHNDDDSRHHARAEFLLAGARPPVDVQPVHLGWRAPAAQSGGHRGLFCEPHVPMPNIAVWVSIPIHLLAGLAILVGYKTRWAAAVLLLLCLGTAFGVHLPAGDTENMINFYKNLVMAGGFLYVINFGAGVLSFDDGIPAR